MSELWVITSYFNPEGYGSRRENYRRFRRALTAPLLTIELGCGGSYSLDSDEADRLVQLRGGDVMWQKERLLNLALDHLPAECRCVAWLDCDLLMHEPDWPRRIIEALRKHKLLQLFRTVHHLRPEADPAAPQSGPIEASQESFGSAYSRGAVSFARMAGREPLPFAPGHAWAMQREELERCGFYDAAILGGGALLMAAAAVGRIEEAEARFGMVSRQAAHYRRWARTFYAIVGSRLGFLDTDLFHLWHGDRRHRAYGQRYARLGAADFDPAHDLRLDADGAWRWNSEKPGLHRDVARYFGDRREDGPCPTS